ncbi:MAG: deoxyribose-phosphate aldolase [Candidatus Bipolaricaulia bacterium]
MRRQQLAQMIDHTLIGPETSADGIRRLCKEAIQYGFASVLVNPRHVALAVEQVREHPIKVATVIGFPQGANAAAVKAFEARIALDDGAEELDMVIDIAALKAMDYRAVLNEIHAVGEVLEKRPAGGVLKVILETALLSDEQIVAGCILAVGAGADHVKTSTGFGPGGATVEAVRLMRKTVGTEFGVTAAGGIRDYETAVQMIDAGATRIGTSSGVEIIEGAPEPESSSG